MKQEQIAQAIALGTLLDAAREAGASVSIGEKGDIYLVRAGGEPHRLGDNIDAAVAELGTLTAPAWNTRFL